MTRVLCLPRLVAGGGDFFSFSGVEGWPERYADSDSKAFSLVSRPQETTSLVRPRAMRS